MAKKTQSVLNPYEDGEIPKERKIAILGTAPSIVDAPFDDPTWEKWAIGATCGRPEVKKLDLIVEIHPEYAPDGGWRRETSSGIMKFAEQGVPVMLQYALDDVPNSVEFPIGPLGGGGSLRLSYKAAGGSGR